MSSCALLCFLAACVLSNGAEVQLRSALQTVLQRSASERVDIISRSFHLVEGALQLPKNSSKEQQAHVVEALESQQKILEERLAQITNMDKTEKARLLTEGSQKLKGSMKPADRAMMEKMDAWDKRMNEKTRLGAMDVISKLKNAIHFVKKGALQGDQEAQAGLGKVLETMSHMSGQNTGSFLH
eukprot:CAMPEP_0170590918 /NCGR_PEP_ID=MMETSP0224-20130122/12125_1 /TAXON_ID=285029 /ORGANISM="Togula jolla, Strain CCCM 725" /LENGTH=183 /DNA_ID=CAMNT_0010914745 /DNA_START=64 /DNA_END=615 /DNA_ORIENTATION=+